MNGIVGVTVMTVAAACAKKQPEPEPTPITIAQAVMQAAEADARARGGEVGGITIKFVEPSESDYVGLIVAAAGWARKSIRSLGVLQQTNGHPLWQRASEAAAQKYGLRPIQLEDYTMVCGTPQRQQTSITQAKPVCTMKYVEAVMQLNAVRMSSDSGWVGIGITRVPTGATRPETVYQCITLARKGPDWDARRSYMIQDPHRCPRGIP